MEKQVVKIVKGLPFLVGTMAEVISSGDSLCKVRLIKTGTIEIIPVGHLEFT